MLFQEWANRPIHIGKKFITDGVVDRDTWQGANPKILFLGKEAYGGSFDLCEEIRESAPYKNWYTVAEWAYAITEVLSTGVLPEFRPAGVLETWEQYNSWLRKIAFVNIKKSSGDRASEKENLMSYVESDKDLLAQQIDELNPDVVLCCYTYEDFYGVIYAAPNTEITRVSEWCMRHKVGNKIRLVIDFYHFANQYPNKVMYYALCAVLLKYKTTS